MVNWRLLPRKCYGLYQETRLTDTTIYSVTARQPLNHIALIDKDYARLKPMI
jgi:hypothetical protein